jgi:hypothetical protein
MKMGCRPGDIVPLWCLESPKVSRTWEPRTPRTVATSTRLGLLIEGLLFDGCLVWFEEGGLEMEQMVERCAGLL